MLDAKDRSWGARWRSAEASERLASSVDSCWRFFIGEAEAQKAVRKLVDILERENVPYAVIGGLALNEYGHRRVTVDVDLVMREEDLQAFKGRWLGRGYAERVPGTGKLLDTDFDVRVDVRSTGRFPGDDKPKPIAFPDPATTAVRGPPFALLPIELWIELKLASGLVAAHRLKDLADVQELIGSAGLPLSMADALHPWVREKFIQLWQAVAEGAASDPYRSEGWRRSSKGTQWLRVRLPSDCSSPPGVSLKSPEATRIHWAPGSIRCPTVTSWPPHAGPFSPQPRTSTRCPGWRWRRASWVSPA